LIRTRLIRKHSALHKRSGLCHQIAICGVLKYLNNVIEMV